MAAVAYDLDRFETRKRQEPARKPRVRVSKVQRSKASGQVAKMLRVLLATTLMVLLVCGVLYTQTQVTELQSQIDKAGSTLDEEEALYAHLSFELQNMSTQRNIEQRAEELGLVKLNSNQIIYVKVDEGNQIEVKEKPFSGWFNKAETGLLSVLDHLNPQPEEGAE